MNSASFTLGLSGLCTVERAVGSVKEVVSK